MPRNRLHRNVTPKRRIRAKKAEWPPGALFVTALAKISSLPALAHRTVEADADCETCMCVSGDRAGQEKRGTVTCLSENAVAKSGGGGCRILAVGGRMEFVTECKARACEGREGMRVAGGSQGRAVFPSIFCNSLTHVTRSKGSCFISG